MQSLRYPFYILHFYNDNMRTTNPYYAHLQSEVLEQITTHFNYSSSGVDFYLSGHRYMYNDNRIRRKRNR